MTHSSIIKSLSFLILMMLSCPAFGYRTISRGLLTHVVSIRGGSQLAAENGTGKKLKLVYFDARGAAELARILLKVGGLDFEDERYKMVPKPTGGFDTPEFIAAKVDGSLAVNMDRVPLLLVNGRPLGQSRAIERYIAAQCGMLGRDDFESAEITCIVENVKDIKEKWGKVRMTGGFAPSDEKDKAIKQFFDTDLSPWLVKLEKSIPDQEFGDKITYADVAVWNLLKDTFLDQQSLVDKLSKDLSKITKMTSKVDANLALKKWIEERPKTTF